MLSVVVATWNSSKTLERCLASLTPFLDRIESIVVVDNCSTDNTVEIASRLIPAAKLECVSEPDQGIYDAFNKGVGRARGDAIYFLGSDDFVLPGFGKLLDDPRLGQRIVVGAVRHGAKVLRHSSRCPGWSLLYSNIPHQGMLIPKSLLQQFPYDTRYPILADYAWNLSHFWSIGKHYVFRSDIGCEWSAGGISSLRTDANFKQDKAAIIDQHAPRSIRMLYGAFCKVKQLSK